MRGPAAARYPRGIPDVQHAVEPARPNRRRKIATFLLAGCLALGAVAGLSQGVTACSAPKPEPVASARPLNAVEAGKLADVRLHNFEDGRAAVSGLIGSKDKEVSFHGWIDWRRPLVYIRTAQREGMPGLLIQAVPGLVAIRAEQKAASNAEPPAIPPTGNWRVRPLGLPVPQKPDPMDGLIALLFSIAAQHADEPELLRGIESQWLRHDTLDGTPVEVLLGPATIPTAAPSPSSSVTPWQSATPAPTKGLNPAALQSPTPSPSAAPDPKSLLAHGGPVAYWVDGNARVRRLEALLADDIRARVDFDRQQRPELAAIDAFGGAVVAPRPVSAAEARALSMMRRRTLAARGGRMTITLALPPSRMIAVDGWLDWRSGIAYAIVHDLDDAKRDVLVHAGRTTVALRAVTGKPQPTPPVPVPRGKWERRAWTDLGVRTPATELDVLLHEALSVGMPARDNAAALVKSAYRLRLDTLGGRQVAVFEIHTPADGTGAAGTALMRYWVDPSGVVRRLEVRTRLGFAQLDIHFGKRPPAIPARV